jgi:hypothetical protein
MTIPRYNIDNLDASWPIVRFISADDGKYVLFADHQPIVAELQAKIDTMRTYSHETVRGEVDWRDQRIAALEAENADLRKCIDGVAEINRTAAEEVRQVRDENAALKAAVQRLSVSVSDEEVKAVWSTGAVMSSWDENMRQVIKWYASALIAARLALPSTQNSEGE